MFFIINFVEGQSPEHEYYNRDFIVLTLRYRGNALCFNNTGPLEPYDHLIDSPANYDVDDVLAFIHAVTNPVNIVTIEDHMDTFYYYEKFPMIDTFRIGMLGGSRGGSPTYLAKIRDNYYGKNQIHSAMIVFGSLSDYFSDDVKSQCMKYILYDGYYNYDFQNKDYYFIEDYSFIEGALQPLLKGDITIQQARIMMLRSSPYYWSQYLTNTQITHGFNDEIVRV